jgi:hypothetical protein
MALRKPNKFPMRANGDKIQPIAGIIMPLQANGSAVMNIRVVSTHDFLPRGQGKPRPYGH